MILYQQTSGLIYALTFFHSLYITLNLYIYIYSLKQVVKDNSREMQENFFQN